MNETGGYPQQELYPQTEQYKPLAYSSLKTRGSYYIPGEMKGGKKKCNGAVVAIAVITTLVIIGLLIIAIIAIIWVINAKKSSEVPLLSLPISEDSLRNNTQNVRIPIKP